MRQLKPRKGEKLINYFNRIEDNEDEIDALKEPDEYWVFTYANGRSRKVYKNIGLAIRHMRGYQLSQAIAEAQAEDDDEFEGNEIADDLNQSIDFMTFGGTPLEYVIPNEERIKMRNAERQRIRRAAKKLLGKTGPDFGSNIDLVEQLTKRVEELEGKGASKAKRVSKSKPVAKSVGPKKSAAKGGASRSGKAKATKKKSGSKHGSRATKVAAKSKSKK